MNTANRQNFSANRKKLWLKRSLHSAAVMLLVAGLILSQMPARQTAAGPDVDPERSIFGVQTFEYTDQGGVQQLAETDTAWVRGFELVWSELESTGPDEPWVLPAELVSQLEAARTDGIEPILTVRGTPPWAWKYEPYTCGPIAETEFDAFASFIIEALNALPTTAAVDYLEIWNEPDVAWQDVAPDRPWGGCWGERDDSEYYGGDYYAAMLQEVYPTVKAVFPDLQILIGGLQMECDPNLPLDSCVSPNLPDPRPTWKHNSTKFFNGILAGGGGPYFDGISFHAYDHDNPDNPRGQYANLSWNTAWNSTGPVLVAKVRYLRDALQQYGVSGKYLVSTENSLLSDTWENNAAFEQTKAGYLVKSYALSLHLGLKANLWFEMVGRWDKGAGLLNPSLDPYPAYTAYQVASQKLYDVQPLGEIQRNPQLTGYEFRTATGLLWVVWSRDGNDVTADLGVEPVRVLDIYGELTSVQTNPLPFSYQPVYIELPAEINRQYVPVLPRAYYPFMNGDFEAALAGWQAFDGGLPVSLVSQPVPNPVSGGNDLYIPAGQNSVRLGSPLYNCSQAGVPFPAYAAVQQTITLPEASAIELQFDYILYTEDGMPASGGERYDRFEMYVDTGSGLELRFVDGNAVNSGLSCGNWRRVPGAENIRGGVEDGWATASIDLSDYAGMNVVVSFQNHSRADGYYNTYTYIDNVRLVTLP